ncbi:MAG: 50S ribosomal protein L9 [bacterium]
MKVILRENVDKLGRTGDIVVVADGYGRNYLLPRGLAAKASTKDVKQLEHQKRIIQYREEKQRSEAQDLAKRLDAVACTLARKVGDEDRLFGSVTTRDIEEALHREGIPIDRKRIILEEPIKKLGAYSIAVKLHPEVTATVKITVVKE